MRPVSFVVAAALTVAPLITASTSFAQAPPPFRNGNTWGGKDHQPTEAQIRQRERAAGIAPSQAQRDATASTIDHLNEEILNQARG